MNRADSVIFACLFTAIGTMMLLNQPPTGAGFVIVCGGISYAAAAVFAFRAIVARR